MIYGVIDERGKIISRLSASDVSRIDSNCKLLEGFTDWELGHSNLLTWDFVNEAWVVGEYDAEEKVWTLNEFPPEPPPVDPNQQWHDQLAIAGFTEEQIIKIIAIG